MQQYNLLSDIRFDDIEVHISRSGYTGEDGYEISVADDKARQLCDRLLSHEDVMLIGLGARDSLRLEASPKNVPRVLSRQWLHIRPEANSEEHKSQELQPSWP